jgi:hypothetical protein
MVILQWLGFNFYNVQLIIIRAEKRIFFLGEQPGDKNSLLTNGVFLC